MYERIKMLYLEGKLEDYMLDNAVKKGYITEIERNEIKILKERRN